MATDLDVCLTLHADHTFNASTFACREVVSTRAHMYAGVAAGIGALSGSLHGRAGWCSHIIEEKFAEAQGRRFYNHGLKGYG
jgi:hypothetical protein